MCFKETLECFSFFYPQNPNPKYTHFPTMTYSPTTAYLFPGTSANAEFDIILTFDFGDFIVTHTHTHTYTHTKHTHTHIHILSFSLSHIHSNTCLCISKMIRNTFISIPSNKTCKNQLRSC
jgi:hypothetical protein